MICYITLSINICEHHSITITQTTLNVYHVQSKICVSLLSTKSAHTHFHLVNLIVLKLLSNNLGLEINCGYILALFPIT